MESNVASQSIPIADVTPLLSAPGKRTYEKLVFNPHISGLVVCLWLRSLSDDDGVKRMPACCRTDKHAE